MLQKLIKSSSVDTSLIDSLSPPNFDQMMSDLSRIRPDDPIFQLAPLNYFSANFSTISTTSISPSSAEKSVIDEKLSSSSSTKKNEKILGDLSKLSILCDQIRDAESMLNEKKSELKSLTKSAVRKREELEGIVSWTTNENDVGDGEKDEKIDDDEFGDQ